MFIFFLCEKTSTVPQHLYYQSLVQHIDIENSSIMASNKENHNSYSKKKKRNQKKRVIQLN